jgi:hypothetical protein
MYVSGGNLEMYRFPDDCRGKLHYFTTTARSFGIDTYKIITFKFSTEIGGPLRVHGR